MFNVIGARPALVAYRGTQVNGTTGQLSYNLSSVGFGAVHATRYVIVALLSAKTVATANGDPVVTIGGQTTTLIINNTVSLSQYHQLWIAAVPDNTSQVIAVSRIGTMQGVIVDVWAAYYLKQAGAAHHTLVVPSGNPASGSLNTRPGGIAVGQALSGTSGTWTWGGLTKDNEQTGSGGLANARYSAASKSRTGQGPLTVSSLQATSNEMIAASFR